jgi:chromosome segregation ATPase
MAMSMASKLTPAELSIILRMREKLHKCEADVIRWRHEKEDAEANLASVEAVKEFLVARVRDTERAVQAQKEEMREVRKKSLEDQEVIVFLDERVKELEKAVEELKLKEATMKKESSDIANKNEKKSRVLSDMLRFEREQVAANENEWKNAKKLLVKEVRSCRARIVALEAEIEGCSQQNAQLKRGLIALQSSGSTSPGKKSLKSMGHSNKGSNY